MSTESVEQFISRNAGHRGNTPLMLLLYKFNAPSDRLMQLMDEYLAGADPRARNDEGYNTLFFALQGCTLENMDIKRQIAQKLAASNPEFLSADNVAGALTRFQSTNQVFAMQVLIETDLSNQFFIAASLLSACNPGNVVYVPLLIKLLVQKNPPSLLDNFVKDAPLLITALKDNNECALNLMITLLKEHAITLDVTLRWLLERLEPSVSKTVVDITVLLIANSNVASQDSQGNNALVYALYSCNDKNFKFKCNVAVELLRKDRTILTSAVQKFVSSGNACAMKVLREIGALTADVVKPQLLLVAAAGKHADVVDVLLDSGSDVNVADATGRTAMSLAALNGSADIVEYIWKAARDRARSAGRNVAADIRRVLTAVDTASITDLEVRNELDAATRAAELAEAPERAEVRAEVVRAEPRAEVVRAELRAEQKAELRAEQKAQKAQEAEAARIARKQLIQSVQVEQRKTKQEQAKEQAKQAKEQAEQAKQRAQQAKQEKEALELKFIQSIVDSDVEQLSTALHSAILNDIYFSNQVIRNAIHDIANKVEVTDNDEIMITPDVINMFQEVLNYEESTLKGRTKDQMLSRGILIGLVDDDVSNFIRSTELTGVFISNYDDMMRLYGYIVNMRTDSVNEADAARRNALDLVDAADPDKTLISKALFNMEVKKEIRDEWAAATSILEPYDFESRVRDRIIRWWKGKHGGEEPTNFDNSVLHYFIENLPSKNKNVIDKLKELVAPKPSPKTSSELIKLGDTYIRGYGTTREERMADAKKRKRASKEPKALVPIPTVPMVPAAPAAVPTVPEFTKEEMQAIRDYANYTFERIDRERVDMLKYPELVGYLRKIVNNESAFANFRLANDLIDRITRKELQDLKTRTTEDFVNKARERGIDTAANAYKTFIADVNSATTVNAIQDVDMSQALEAASRETAQLFASALEVDWGF